MKEEAFLRRRFSLCPPSSTPQKLSRNLLVGGEHELDVGPGQCPQGDPLTWRLREGWGSVSTGGPAHLGAAGGVGVSVHGGTPSPGGCGRGGGPPGLCDLRHVPHPLCSVLVSEGGVHHVGLMNRRLVGLESPMTWGSRFHPLGHGGRAGGSPVQAWRQILVPVEAVECSGPGSLDLLRPAHAAPITCFGAEKGTQPLRPLEEARRVSGRHAVRT